MFTDNIHQVVERLRMYLHIRYQQHFQGLQGTDDLLLDGQAGAHLDHHLVSEYLHLIL